MTFVIQSLVSQARPITSTRASTSSMDAESAPAPRATITGPRHSAPARNEIGTNTRMFAVDSTAGGARYGNPTLHVIVGE